MRAIRVLKRTNALLPTTLRMTPAINFILCASNIRELPLMIDLAHYLGASSLFCYKMVFDFNPKLAGDDYERFPAFFRHYHDQAVACAVARGIEFHCPEPDPDIPADPDAGPPGGGLFHDGYDDALAANPPGFANLIDDAGVEDEAVSLAGRALECAIERHETPSDADIREARGHAKALLATLDREFQARFFELSADEVAIIRGARQSEATFLDCHFLHEALYFEANGDVRPCCMLTLRELAGNSARQGVAEIFQGPALAKFTADFHQGSLCEDCRACPIKQTVRMKDLFE
jgi:radical SAM protein with 4Fe4S-binding SPASM domain